MKNEIREKENTKEKKITENLEPCINKYPDKPRQNKQGFTFAIYDFRFFSSD